MKKDMNEVELEQEKEAREGKKNKKKMNIP